jgi:hypothetical protein
MEELRKTCERYLELVEDKELLDINLPVEKALTILGGYNRDF